MKTLKYKYYVDNNTIGDKGSCSFWRTNKKENHCQYRYDVDTEWTDYYNRQPSEFSFSDPWKEISEDEFNELIFIESI